MVMQGYGLGRFCIYIAVNYACPLASTVILGTLYIFTDALSLKYIYLMIYNFIYIAIS